jgi:hypothetical protein
MFNRPLSAALLPYGAMASVRALAVGGAGRLVSKWPVLLALLLGLGALPGATAAQAQDWRTLTTRRQVAGERDLKVNVEFGAGRFQVEPAADGELYHASIRYDAASFEPIADYAKGVLRLGIEGSGRTRRNIREGSQLTLGLSPELPLDLKLAFGAAEAELELGGIRVRNAEISTGASDTRLRFSRPNRQELERLELTAGAASFQVSGLGNANARRITFKGGVGDITLDFSGEWQGDTRAEVSMGVGSLTLRLPRGVGVRLGRDTFLVAFDPQGLVKRGDGYYSEDWESARHRLTIDVKGAFGSVDVRWIASGETQTN